MKILSKYSSLVFIMFISCMILLQACKKEENTNNTSTDKLEFVSLNVEKDTITVQDLTKITAKANGKNLSYSWSCDNELGIIEGSGSEILFTICHAGKFKITCKVIDGSNNEISKDAYVTSIE
jgi:hypothetical protein